MTDWAGSLTPIAPSTQPGITSVVTYLEGLSWLSRPVGGQALEGLTDGTNRVFRVPFAPIATSPAPAFYTLGSATRTTLVVSSTNYDTGEVIFASAPATTPFCDYTVLAVTGRILANASVNGFAEMQVRWRRSIFIYNGNVSGSSTSQVDTEFADSAVQNAFLNRCAEYELCRMLATDATFNAVSYREERMGGLLVDTSKRPKDWDTLLKSLLELLRTTEDAARSEMGESDGFGTFLPGPQLIDGRWTDDDF